MRLNPQYLAYYRTWPIRKVFVLYKYLYQHLVLRETHNKQVLFIVGCQRSGTNTLSNIFRRDLKAYAYPESGTLTSLDANKVRLNPPVMVNAEIVKQKASLIVIKPLVESQNILDLLSYYKGSKAIWLYRHYKDVAASNLNYFGIENGVNNLRPITENSPDNWRSEKVSTQTREAVLRLFSKDMNPHDAAAIFWFVRNRIFFELDLEGNQDIMLCPYRSLVTNPRESIGRIYRQLGRKYPGDWTVRDVNPSSLGRGSTIKLSPKVQDLCENTLKELNDAFQRSIQRPKPEA